MGFCQKTGGSPEDSPTKAESKPGRKRVAGCFEACDDGGGFVVVGEGFALPMLFYENPTGARRTPLPNTDSVDGAPHVCGA